MLQPYTVGRRPERIDHIAHAIYGSERNGSVELLWGANVGLAELGAFVKPGTVVQVPNPPPTSQWSVFVLPWQ